MVRKIFLVFFAVLVGMHFVLADPCTTLKDNTVITHPTFVCKDKYYIYQGITLEGNEAVLDCQGAILVGNNATIGITVKADDAAVRYCNFEGFRTAVYIDDAISVKIDRNNFTSNVVGINAHLSSYSLRENKFSNNLIDISNETVDFDKLLRKEEPKKEMLNQLNLSQSNTSSSSVSGSPAITSPAITNPAVADASADSASSASIASQQNGELSAENSQPQPLTGSASGSIPNSVASSIFFVKVFVIVLLGVGVVMFFYSELRRE